MVDLYGDIIHKRYWSESLNNRIIAFRLCQCELAIINKIIIQKVSDQDFVKELQVNIKLNLKKAIASDYPLWKKIQMIMAAKFFPIYKIFITIIHLNRIKKG